jgi:hypothetical protein
MKNTEILTSHPELSQTDGLEFESRLSQLETYFSVLWTSTSDEFAAFGEEYDLAEQRSTEADVDKTILAGDKLDPSSEEETLLLMQRLKASVRNLVVRAVSPEHREATRQMLSEFSETGDEFVRQARAFDRDLEPDDIFQALRNLWIINSMQVAFDRPVCASRAGLAYSLLYPYTDNYLDGASVSGREKREFSRILAGRLSGIEMPIRSAIARRVSDLVVMIESEYPRAAYPGVYGSLIAIHRAQEGSLLQHSHQECLAQSNILDISVKKGGSSVLADGYLAKGELSLDEAEFAFGYGVFLQFIDDLQDVEEDLRNGHQTLFTLAATNGTLESMANRLVRFTRQVITTSKFLSRQRMRALAELVDRSCVWLILESIALNARLYTGEYLAAVEPYSPLRFDYICRIHSEMRTKQKKFRMVFNGARFAVR